MLSCDSARTGDITLERQKMQWAKGSMEGQADLKCRHRLHSQWIVQSAVPFAQ